MTGEPEDEWSDAITALEADAVPEVVEMDAGSPSASDRATTPPAGVETLAGFEIGLRVGQARGERIGEERVLAAMELALTTGGTHEDIARELVRRLREFAGIRGH